MGRGISYYIRFLKALSNLTLNTSNGRASITSLGNLLQWCTTLILQTFFLISNLNLSTFISKAWPLVLSLQTLIFHFCALVWFRGPVSAMLVSCLLYLVSPMPQETWAVHSGYPFCSRDAGGEARSCTTFKHLWKVQTCLAKASRELV